MSVKQLELRPEALHDLLTIWAYSEHRWGEAQADSYTADIRDTMIGLASGRIKSGASRISGYRAKRARSHIIYFHETDIALVVVRILHGSMDAERHLPADAG